MKFFVRLILPTKGKKKETLPEGWPVGRRDPITRPGIRWSSDRWLLPMHNQPLKQTLFPPPPYLPHRWKCTVEAALAASSLAALCRSRWRREVRAVKLLIGNLAEILSYRSECTASSSTGIA